jgi:hypothetical protein
MKKQVPCDITSRLWQVEVCELWAWNPSDWLYKKNSSFVGLHIWVQNTGLEARTRNRSDRMCTKNGRNSTILLKANFCLSGGLDARHPQTRQLFTSRIKESMTADKGWSSSLRDGRKRPTTLTVKKIVRCEILYRASGLGKLFETAQKRTQCHVVELRVTWKNGNFLTTSRYSTGLRAVSQWGMGIFLFTTASRTALRPTQPPIQWVPGALSLRVQKPGHEADHSPPSSAEVNEWV